MTYTQTSTALVSTHAYPLIDEESVETCARIDRSHGTGWERLFTNDDGLGEDENRILNIPHFAYGLNVGSLVLTNDFGQIVRVLKVAPEATYRVSFKSYEAKLEAISNEELHKYAYVEPGFGRLICVQARPGEDASLEAFIEALLSEGLVEDVADVMRHSFDVGHIAESMEELGYSDDEPSFWVPGVGCKTLEEFMASKESAEVASQPLEPHIAEHPHPVPEDASALEAWTFQHPNFGPGWEKLFVSHLGGDRWEVMNIPFFVYGLKIGAIVRLNRKLWIEELIENPPEFVGRISFIDEATKYKAVLKYKLEDIAVIEWGYGDTLCIQAKPGSDEAIRTVIRRMNADGLIRCVDDAMDHPFNPAPYSIEMLGDLPNVTQITWSAAEGLQSNGDQGDLRVVDRSAKLGLSDFKKFQKGLDDDHLKWLVGFFQPHASAIDALRLVIGEDLPDDLHALWNELGWGYVNGSIDGALASHNLTKILSPEAITGVICLEYVKEKLWQDGVLAIPFAEIVDAMWHPLIAVIKNGPDAGKVVTLMGRDHIAASIPEFLARLATNPSFHTGIVVGSLSINARVSGFTEDRDRTEMWVAKCREQA